MTKLISVLFVLFAALTAFSTAEAKPRCQILHGPFGWSWELVEGACKRGLAHGKGKAQDSRGTIFEGTFRNGSTYGKGVLIHPGGDRRECEWRDGEPFGQTRYISAELDGRAQVSSTFGDDDTPLYQRLALIWPNGEYYHGMTKRGRREGHGIHHWLDGVIFEGEWDSDQPIEAKGRWKFSPSPSYRDPDILYAYAERLEGEGNTHWAGLVYNYLLTYFPTSGPTLKLKAFREQRREAIEAVERERREAEARRKAAEKEAQWAKTIAVAVQLFEEATRQEATETSEPAPSPERSRRQAECWRQYEIIMVQCASKPEKVFTGEKSFLGSPIYDHPRFDCEWAAKNFAKRNCQ